MPPTWVRTNRALVVISVDPDIGEALPSDTVGPQPHRYTDDVEAVRILYFVTVLRTVVVVAYIQVWAQIVVALRSAW